MDEPENRRTCTSPVAMSTMLVSPDLVEQQTIDPAGATFAMSAVDEASIVDAQLRPATVCGFLSP